MALSICFAAGALGPSGGVRAIMRHATALARDHGMDVSLAVDSPEGADAAGLPLLTFEQAQDRSFDVAIATWWRTAYSNMRVPARRHAYFVQQLEDRLYRDGDVERFGAALTHDLPVHFLSEARWIAELLEELQGGARLPARPERDRQGPVRPVPPARSGRDAARARGGQPAALVQGHRRGGRGAAPGRGPARDDARDARAAPARGRRRVRPRRRPARARCHGGGLRVQRRPAQAVSRRGRLHAAARGLPHGGHLRRLAGDGARRVRRARSQRRRVRLRRHRGNRALARAARARQDAARPAARGSARDRGRLALAGRTPRPASRTRYGASPPRKRHRPWTPPSCSETWRPP